MRVDVLGPSRLYALSCCFIGKSITAVATDLAAACYPTLPGAIGDFKCEAPESSYDENQATWEWAVNDDSAFLLRECLDWQCDVPSHHVRLSYLGGQLFEYNLSFEVMVLGHHESATAGVLGLLSIGWNTISLRDAPWNESVTFGVWHKFEVRAYRNGCTILLDDVEATVVNGTGPEYDEGNKRRCAPLGTYPQAALIGGQITGNFRSVYSKLSGQVRNVVLYADVPELTTTTTLYLPPAPEIQPGMNILGGCFPFQADADPGIYPHVQCSAPGTLYGSTAVWTYKEGDIDVPECMDELCTQAPLHHARLNWLGPPLYEYNLTFDFRWLEAHPEGIQKVLGLLSIGGGVMSLSFTHPFRDVLGDGQFHNIALSTNFETCYIWMDGTLLQVFNGTDYNFQGDTWRCRPLQTWPNSVIFGGYVPRSSRKVYSRVSGMVANVLLQAEIPLTTTTTTQTAFSNNNELPEIEGHEMAWTPELEDMWKILEGSWTGTYSATGGSCTLDNSSTDAKSCCLETEVALDIKITFLTNEAKLWMEMLISGDDPGLRVSSGEVVALSQKRRSMAPIIIGPAGEKGFNITVLHMPSATFQGIEPEREQEVMSVAERPYCLHLQEEEDGKLRLSLNATFGFVAIDDANTRVVLQHVHCPAVYTPPPLGGCTPGQVVELRSFVGLDNLEDAGPYYMSTGLLTKDGAALDGGNTTTTTTTLVDGPDLQGPDTGGGPAPSGGNMGLPVPLVAGGASLGGILVLCAVCWCFRRRQRRRPPPAAKEVEDIFTNAKLDTLVPMEQQDQLAELSFSKRSSVSPAITPQGTTPSPGQTSSPPGTTPSPPSAGESSSDFTFNIFKSLHAKEIAACCRMEHCFIRQVDVKLVERVGSGSFGAVWRGALYGVTDVAVKVPLDERGKQDPARVESVANELRVFRRIRHPDIVLFFGGCMMSGDRLSLVLEWVNGSDLKDYSRKRRVAGEWDINLATESLPDNPIREFVLMQDVSRGMHYLHMQEPLILHRDLKPANILVETSHDPPHAKIADFGLSFLLEHTNPHSRTGTRAYMAPEVFRFEPYSSAADVFSYGCLAIFVIKGENPDPAIAQQQIHALEVKGGQLALLREVCSECLYFDPRQRPHAASVYDGIMRPLGTPWTPERGECKREKREIYNVIRENDVLMFLEEMNPESPQQEVNLQTQAADASSLDSRLPEAAGDLRRL